MRNLFEAATRVVSRDEGQDLLEYGLLVSLIATFMIGALTMVGDRINGTLWGMIAAARF